jgi:hypothetical protein
LLICNVDQQKSSDAAPSQSDHDKQLKHRYGCDKRGSNMVVTVAEGSLPPSCHAAADSDNLERTRLKVLRRFAILDTPPEAGFDRITAIAARLLAAPIALISLVDHERQWFKSRYGVALHETPRAGSLCGIAVLGREVLEVPDARADPRFADSPLVNGPPFIRFYAGAPLIAEDGAGIGVLCIIDRTPRRLSDEHRRVLADLAGLVVELVRLRASGLDLRREAGASSDRWAASCWSDPIPRRPRPVRPGW